MAQVHIGQITATVQPDTGAEVHIGQITATVTPAGPTGARVHIGQITASITSPQTAPGGRFARKAGAWVPRSPRGRKAGPFVPTTPRTRVGNAWKSPTPTPPPPGPTPPEFPGYELFMADSFATLDPARWYAYDNSTFGADGGRIQLYLKRNVSVGPSSDGLSNSLKLTSKREQVGGKEFTAGMLDTKTAGWYLPCYHRKEIRAKFPHGQGIWWAWWSTAFNGGAGMVELDDSEGFTSQVPGRTVWTLHRKNNSGVYQKLVAKNRGPDDRAGTFFETPTHSPAWHTLATEVYPVTDATGAIAGDPTKPSSFVRFKAHLNGVKYLDYVDTQALFWTTNGGDPADPLGRFWNIYLQGSQIDGEYVGHPDDPIGYSHLLDRCISGTGVAPDGCPVSVGGVPIIRAQFPNHFELDYHRVWKYTG